MAPENRQERRLMRQRGAGTRNVANADFGFDFGFGGSRQDRQQMRKGGVGNHKVGSADSGLSFRSSERPRRSASRGTHSSVPNARALSGTPGRRSREPSVERSRRSTSAVSNGGLAQGGSRDEPEYLDSQENPLAKRRKLTVGTSLNHPPPERPSSRSDHTSRRNASSMFSIAEAPDGEDALINGRIEEDFDDAVLTSLSPRFVSEHDIEKENVVPGGGKSISKTRKRKSIGQQSMRKKKRSSKGSSAGAKSALRRNPIAASRPESPIEAEESLLELAPDQDAEDNITAEASVQPPKLPPKRRKKRKSVVLVKKKRRSSEGTGAPSRAEAAKADAVSDHDEDEADDAYLARPVRRTIHQPSPLTRSSPIIRSIEVDEASDDEYIDEEDSPEPPTPAAPKKAPKGSKSGGTTTTSSALGRSRATTRQRKSTLPILTHRMTNIDALPTIREDAEDKDSNDGDETAVLGPSSDRAAPNAVDVLAQICRETVGTAIERMETEDASQPRMMRQRKRSALEAFGADLDSRLFEMSDAVEDRLTLEARVRKAKREKADLQARWIEVRKQRERVALRCDRVRREHWENERAREERWRISEAARKAELELEKNEVDDDEEEEEALEYLLRSVAAEVTDFHDGGGLLNRMRAFNQHLERVAGLLEGRVT